MKTIYLMPAIDGSGLRFTLVDLKDDSISTINTKYPGVIQGVKDTLAACEKELSENIFFFTVAPYHDFIDNWFIGKIHISAPGVGDKEHIQQFVRARLTKLFTKLGFAVSSVMPD